MQLIIKGKNMNISDSLRDYVDKKIGRLSRFLPDISEARVELSVQKTKSSQDRQVVQVTMRSNGTILRAEERNADMLAAIDAVKDKLQRQIKRFKERPIRRLERAQAAVAQPDVVEEPPLPPQIVRLKRFSITPMTEQEAIDQMELLGHDFFIFYNPNVSSLNVLYRRRDGNYGLLHPELT
jgi:putative sigma-54 modulation protein